mgnify:FL=1
MLSAQDLKKRLNRIDAKGYKAYKDLQGGYDLGNWTLHIDHVQSDPFAPPSKLRVVVREQRTKFPAEFLVNPVRRTAAEDFLTRRFSQWAGQVASEHRQRGKGERVGIDGCGQEILLRTSMMLREGHVEARCTVGLPARGRTILGRRAEAILLQDLPRIVEQALIWDNTDQDSMRRHVECCEDQAFLRQSLQERGLVAFIANGSLLPRQSGISDRPLNKGHAIPFVSPSELEVSFDLPHAGEVRGMGIPEGVTLVVGGGYHGKSTLLRAMERGIYNHIPGDGREGVVTVDSAVKVRAEDGRSVTGVDIHPFVSQLPFAGRTDSFSSDNASGSTSQAANIMEALEAGAGLLLVDEDTSATNFMIRDTRMQHLVPKAFEPITPFVDRVRELHQAFGVSTVLVLGGSGDYIDVADTVIMLREYQTLDVTARAREVASMVCQERHREALVPMSRPSERLPHPSSFAAGPRDRIKAAGLRSLRIGRTDVDLSLVEQLVDPSQTRALAEVFRLLGRDGALERVSLPEVADRILDEIGAQGLDWLSPFQGQHPGELALPRKQEICAAINRWRKLVLEGASSP